MSMQMLTILQILHLTVVYLAVMVLVPALVFYPFFEEKPLGVRFLAYLAIGNFYVINLVFLLQFLHISNRFTLILGIVVPACAMMVKLHWNTWVKNTLSYAGETTYGVMVKTVGVRLILSRLFGALFSTLWKKLKNLFAGIWKHPVDIVGTILVIALAVWQYGTNPLQNFGYMASDTPVHNYWINSLFDNKPFVAGVYPFGMHVIVYFLSEVFGIKIFTLLRIFGLFQDVLMHISLLIFLRIVCKSVFSAYSALVIYLGAQILNTTCIARLFNSLPQEYGMIFILPSIAFLYRFFECRKEEKGIKGWKVESTKELALFAVNFSLTLSVHFYDTMAAGLFCVGAAIGFIAYIFRKEYLWRILLFGILSLFFAILPMGVAVIGGTPLEGSLRWGMSILQTSQPSSTTQNVTVSESSGSSDGGETSAPSAGTVQQEGTVQQAGTVSSGQTDLSQGGATVSQPNQTVVETKSLLDRLLEKGKTIYDALKLADNAYISIYLGGKAPGLELFMLLGLAVCGVFCFLIGERHYGCMAVSVALGTFFLCCVMISKTLGIPALMDQSRCSTYLAYAFMAALGVFLDCITYILFGWLPGQLAKNIFSFAFAGVFVFLVISVFGVREVYVQEALEKNGAIICVTNILRENPPKTYTIISANDELRMIEKVGFFYEIIDLLRYNEGDDKEEYLVIPTPKIYVFVEKVPGEYMLDSPYRGQPVSSSSAEQRLPSYGGLGSYQGANRHIVMSKMYYWAKAFQKLYRNETSVYYEDEEFICYEIDQNVYRPYDLSIDYGYNDAGLTVSE